MPGGRLALRIFEQRYLDMVRECLKNQSGFGVCLIADGKEVGTPASVFPYGTSVEIIDWDSDESGLLMIVTQGVQNFRTINTTLNTNGLLLGEVELLPPGKNITIPTQYSDLVELLRQALLKFKPFVHYAETDFKESVWVANRLVEALPMSPEVRYKLMVIDDPIEQLDALQKFVNNWNP